MQLSISNLAWEKEHDRFFYGQMKRLGYTGLEIAPTRVIPENPYERKKEAARWAESLFKEYGIVISSMQSIWYGRSERLFGTKEERDGLLSYTKKAIEFASALNCHNLVFGSPKNRNLAPEEDPGEAIPFFEELGEYACSRNTVFSLEANPIIYHTNYLNTTKEALNIVKRVNSKGLRVNLDMGTMIYNCETIQELAGEWEWINHIHISEPYLKVVSLQKIHRELAEFLSKEPCYDGYISIEMGSGFEREEIVAVMCEIGEMYRAL